MTNCSQKADVRVGPGERRVAQRSIISASFSHAATPQSCSVDPRISSLARHKLHLLHPERCFRGWLVGRKSVPCVWDWVAVGSATADDDDGRDEIRQDT